MQHDRRRAVPVRLTGELAYLWQDGGQQILNITSRGEKRCRPRAFIAAIGRPDSPAPCRQRRRTYSQFSPVVSDCYPDERGLLKR